MKQVNDTLIAIADLCAPTAIDSIDSWMRRAVAEGVVEDSERMALNRSINAPDGEGAASRLLNSVKAEQVA